MEVEKRTRLRIIIHSGQLVHLSKRRNGDLHRRRGGWTLTLCSFIFLFSGCFKIDVDPLSIAAVLVQAPRTWTAVVVYGAVALIRRAGVQKEA